MIANYHSHTPLCFHATGTPEEYVQAALQRGLQVFGFSDHAPQWFPGDYYSTMRMYPRELTGYCDTVRKLQKEYRGQIRIPLGLEAEYYPAIFAELLLRAKDQGVEYLLLGQHWVGNEQNAPFVSRPPRDESVLKQYCHQVMDAMQTGYFSYLAHPDLVNFGGDLKTYEHYMRQLCREAKSTKTPLELNFLGVSEGRHYPREDFWRIAAEENCDVIFGIDAHTPAQITDPAPEKKCLEITEKYGLHLLETVEFRKL